MAVTLPTVGGSADTWGATLNTAITGIDGRVATLESAPGGGGAVATLSDVALTNPATGEVLKYNAATSKWVNGTDLIGGGTGAGAEWVRVSNYTAANGGQTNAAIQAALNASAGTTPVLIDTPGVYTFTNPLTIGATWPRTVLIAPDKGSVTFRANLATGYYAGTSKAFIKQNQPTRPYFVTGVTTLWPQGTNKLTLTSLTGIAVGQLVLLRLDATTSPGGTNEGNEGEMRVIDAINTATNEIWFDAPLVTNLLNTAAGKTIQIFIKREAHIAGITFDTTETEASLQLSTTHGHGGIALNFFTRVDIEDCDFIGGGRMGFGVTFTHTARVQRCKADNCVTVDTGSFPSSFTDPRSGVFYPGVAPGTDDVSGEAYGFAITATYNLVRDCDGNHARHIFANGATPFHTLWSIYDHCKSERDMQGAYDWHSHTNYAIARDCVASNGVIGFVVRGRNQWIKDCDSFDNVVGLKIFEFADHCRVDGMHIRATSATTDTSGSLATAIQFGHNWNLTSHSGAVLENIEIDGMAGYVIQADTTGQTNRDFVFRGFKITGGTWQSRFAGLWIDPVCEDWRITGAAPGSATTDAPFQFYADAGTATIKGVTVRDITVNGEASALPNLVSLFAATSGGTLAANTYQDITVVDTTMRTTGTPNSAVVVVASGAAISGALDQRRNRVNTAWVGSPAITGSRGSATATVLANLLTALNASGDIVDGTTA